MQTIEVKQGISIGFEEIIKGVQQLDNSSLAQFASEINHLVSKRNAKTYDLKETELLKKIKASIPASVKRRQKQLYEKMQEGALSTIEKDELVLLNNMIEEKTAERILFMGELAKQRNISIQQLATQLEIKPAYE